MLSADGFYSLNLSDLYKKDYFPRLAPCLQAGLAFKYFMEKKWLQVTHVLATHWPLIDWWSVERFSGWE